MGYVQDVRLEIADAKLTSFHVRIIVLIGCVMMFDGYDNFVPAYVIHWTRDAWNLSLPQAGMLVSSGLIGFMIGALANGPIADRIGRKPTLIAALIIAGTFSVATGLFARSFESFVLTRILTGLGLGVLLPLATTYMNEFMPAKVSNVATIIATGSYTIGGMLAGIAGIVLTPSFGWESLFLVGACAIPLALLCIPLLPESPLYLVGAGKPEKAAEALRALRPGKSFDDVTLVLPEQTDRKGSITKLFSRENRLNTILIWFIQIAMLFDAYILIGWTPTVMISRGETFASGFLFGSLLADHVASRRPRVRLRRRQDGQPTDGFVDLVAGRGFEPDRPCGRQYAPPESDLRGALRIHDGRTAPRAKQPHGSIIRDGDSWHCCRHVARRGTDRRDRRARRGRLDSAVGWRNASDVPGDGGHLHRGRRRRAPYSHQRRPTESRHEDSVGSMNGCRTAEIDDVQSGRS